MSLAEMKIISEWLFGLFLTLLGLYSHNEVPFHESPLRFFKMLNYGGKITIFKKSFRDNVSFNAQNAK